jgi:hypothetical protein
MTERIHGWVELGIVTTDTAGFAIVDPAYADVLHDTWNEHLDLPPGDLWSSSEQFHEVDLGEPGHEPLRPGEQALWLRAPVDGGYRVLGRFEDADADAYGDGHMHLAEVLIILIDHEDDDE